MANNLGTLIDEIAQNSPGQPKLGEMFSNCYINTLETTTTVHTTPSIELKNQIYKQQLTSTYMSENPFRTHVITGDIEAMWLRDSMGQFGPYLTGAHTIIKKSPNNVAKLLAKATLILNNQKNLNIYTIPIDRYKILRQLYNGWINYEDKNSNYPISEETRQTIYSMRLITEGLIRRQAELISFIDPLANAFRLTIWNRDLKPFEINQGKGGIIAERKYELDSLCSFLQLTTTFFNQIHKENPENNNFICSPEDSLFIDDILLAAIQNILHVIKVLQHPNQPIEFHFSSLHSNNFTISSDIIQEKIQIIDSYSNPELPPQYWHDIPYTGLSASGFRPSDDVCTFPFHIPSNMFAVSSLSSLYEMLTVILQNNENCFHFSEEKQKLIEILLENTNSLRLEIDEGIHNYAIFNHENFGRIYCYEVDGKGNCLLMDDANNPSLLGIPHYNYNGIFPKDKKLLDELYENTKNFIFSEQNPYFVSFNNPKYFKGAVGSPHTRVGSVWPMSLIIATTTRFKDLFDIVEKNRIDIENEFTDESDNSLPPVWLAEFKAIKDEISILLKTLQETTADTGLMHESFQGAPFKPNQFTREWFSWANSLFAESILTSLPLLFPGAFIID